MEETKATTQEKEPHGELIAKLIAILELLALAKVRKVIIEFDGDAGGEVIPDITFRAEDLLSAAKRGSVPR